MIDRQQRLIIETLLLGVVGALSAQLFDVMLQASQYFFMNVLAGYQPPALPEEGGVLREVIGPRGLWWIPAVTTLGGLLSGLLVYGFAPEAEGHGTDTAVKAFHRFGGLIRTRVAPLKAVASAITIGSGGAAGREGPTALMSAGVGSIYATLAKHSEEDRRLLVLVSMAAGLSAIFRSPIGTAFFSVEVLYSSMEFDAGALPYTTLASVVSYAVNGLFVGWEPLFQFYDGVPVPNLFDYSEYAALGIVCGVAALLLPTVFYGIRDAFHALKIPRHLKPALGGLGVGLLALEFPQILGGGYGWIQEAIDGRLALELLIWLVLAKTLAFSLTVSSGGSGGVFAPSLFVGAMLGGVMAELLHQPPAAFVIVGMAAVFGGAARIPVATLLMVAEMTGGYELLVPAALAVMLSYLVHGRLSPYLKHKSLYEAQVPGRADSPAHSLEHVKEALRLLRERKIRTPDKVGGLNLHGVLSSGIPLELPNGKQLVEGTLSAKSPWVGRPIALSCREEEIYSVELLAVFRRNTSLHPDSEERLEPGDRLLLIATPEERNILAHYLEPPS